MTISGTLSDAKALLALANADRIRILALIADQPLTATDIGTDLGLTADAVTTHLTILGQAGLIATSKDRHERRIHLRTERLDEIETWCRDQFAADTSAYNRPDTIPPGVRQFFRDGRLTTYPSKQSKYLEVLAVLAGDFAPDTDYPESEVNVILLRRHEDFATLRRDLVDFGFMTRANGIYRRTD